jgi:hypothetical protein
VLAMFVSHVFAASHGPASRAAPASQPGKASIG